MMLPPFGAIARVLVSAPRSLSEIALPPGVHTARDDDAVLLRAASRTEIDTAISLIRTEFGTAVRIHIDPYRF